MHPLACFPPRPTARRLVLALGLLMCAVPALAAAPLLLKLSPAQQNTLGLRTAALQAADDAGRLKLQGQAVLPPALLQVLSAPLGAAVEQVLVARGDRVKPGQALLLLNSPQLVEWQREHQQAQLQAQLAEQTASRDANLLAEGLIPAARAQASRNQAQIAQATLRERGLLLQQAGAPPDATLSGRARLASPAPATVLEVLVQAGQRVEAGSPLLKLARQGALWLELQASAEVARQLRLGDRVSLAGCTATAQLSVIGGQVDPGSQMQTLRAAWKSANDCVLPGQRVEADVLLGSAAAPGAWRAPAEAVVKLDGRDVVFVQRPGGFEALTVTLLGAPANGQVLLQATTLKADSIVVVQGAAALKGQAQGLGAP